MAFRLSKTEVAQLKGWQEHLQQDRRQIASHFERLRQTLGSATLAINEIIREHNDRLVAAGKFVETIAERYRDDFDERSERWQQSEAGQAAEAFVEEWEGVELRPVDEIKLLLPDPPHFDESLNVPEGSDS